MYRSLTMRPQSILCILPVHPPPPHTHTHTRCSNSKNYPLSLPRPRIDIFKNKHSSGAFLWNKLPLTDLVTRSVHSIENFVCLLRQLQRKDCDRKLLGVWGDGGRQTDRQTERLSGFRVMGIVVGLSVIGHLRPSFYAHSFLPSPSPPDFVCVCVCVCVCVRVCECVCLTLLLVKVAYLKLSDIPLLVICSKLHI